MPPVLIIGGGVAGAAAAILLARAGKEVTLLEKSRGPHHKVCGEFLSGEALHYLHELGVNPEAMGALPITHLRCVRDRVRAEQTLPFPAMSLTRHALDEALLNIAANSGATVVRGVSVETLERIDHQWRVQSSAGDFRAGNILLANGKHDLRGHPRGSGRQSNLLAFNAYFRLTPAQIRQLQGVIELHLFDKGYAGLQLVEGNLANLGLLITRERFRTLPGGWPGLLTDLQMTSRALSERLAGAEATLHKPLALSAIPYGFQRQSTDPGLWWLGDQAAVIPSFSGDGMSIALHSAFCATEHLLHGGTAPVYQRELAGHLRRQVRLATLVSQCLVGAPWLATAGMRVPRLVRQVAMRTRVRLPGVQPAAIVLQRR